MAAVNAQYRERAAVLEGQRTQLEARRGGLLDVEAQLEKDLEAREGEQQRLSAQLKRVQIVLRNAAQLEAQAKDPAAGVQLPPGHRAQVARAQQQLPIAKQAAAAQQTLVKEAGDRLREARANTQVINKQLRQLDAQRRQLDQLFTQESSTRSALVSDGEQQQRTAWADITRMFLTSDHGQDLSEEEVSELKAHDHKVKRVATEFHRHALAVDSYDPDSYKTGFILMGVVGGGLLLMLVLAMGFSVVGGASDADRDIDKAGEVQPDDGDFEASEEEWDESE
jgi:hypothetical protein